jgi:hypothetical protein
MNVAHLRKSRTELFIPPRTRAEIQSPAAPGGRHEQAKKIALSLLGQKISSDAVFVQLRGMYEDDFSDREIENLINWALARNPQPCGNGLKGNRRFQRPEKREPVSTVVTKEQALENARKFLGDWHCTIAELWRVSPIKPSLDWRNNSSLLLETLYEKGEFVNLVWKFFLDEGKACPTGGGATLPRDNWVCRFNRQGSPRSAAGCWIRPNPVLCTHGSGGGGAHMDCDVAAFRFLLLESDDLPIGMQLSLWSALALPCAAIIDSGGRSVHAWLRVDCKNEQEYRATASRFYQLLSPFRPCPANKNPSRLARLPGVKREIGGSGAAEQRLFYLNPAPRKGQPIFERN